MTTTLNRPAYQQLVDENVAWLKKQPRTLERDHVILIVGQSVGWLYDSYPGLRPVSPPGRTDPVEEGDLALYQSMRDELDALKEVVEAAKAVVDGRIPAVSAQLFGDSDWKHSRISDSLTDRLAKALNKAGKW